MSSWASAKHVQGLVPPVYCALINILSCFLDFYKSEVIRDSLVSKLTLRRFLSASWDRSSMLSFPVACCWRMYSLRAAKQCCILWMLSLAFIWSLLASHTCSQLLFNMICWIKYQACVGMNKIWSVFLLNSFFFWPACIIKLCKWPCCVVLPCRCVCFVFFFNFHFYLWCRHSYAQNYRRSQLQLLFGLAAEPWADLSCFPGVLVSTFSRQTV